MISASTDAVALEKVRHRWLVNPVVDLLFCCGGAVWISSYIYAWLSSQYPGELVQFYSIQFVFLAHLISNPHTSATWMRIYGDSREFTRFHFYAVWLALAMGVLGVVALYMPGWPAALTNIYLLWVVLHYTSQVYGIAMLYCARWNYRFQPWERIVFKYGMIFTAVYSIARKLTWQSYSANYFLGLNMPFWGPLPEWIPTVCFGLWAGTGILFLFIVVDKFFREGVFLPLPACFIVFSGVMFILASGGIMSSVWLFVPPFFHGSQYILVSGVFHFGKKRMDDPSFSSRLFSLPGMKYWIALIVIGNFIYSGFPRILSELGIDFVSGMAVIFSIVNFHHFLTDAAIWKLRDPKTREVLMYG